MFDEMEHLRRTKPSALLVSCNLVPALSSDVKNAVVAAAKAVRLLPRRGVSLHIGFAPATRRDA